MFGLFNLWQYPFLTIMSYSEPITPSSSPSATMLRSPYDPLLLAEMDPMGFKMPEELDLDYIRSVSNHFGLKRALKAKPHFDHQDISIPGLEPGDDDITLAVFTPKHSPRTDRVAFYFVHSGGQVSGHRFAALDVLMDYFDDDAEIVFISVEYRLAPEHRAPAALHDTYAGLVWTAKTPPASALILQRSFSTEARVEHPSLWVQPYCVATPDELPVRAHAPR